MSAGDAEALAEISAAIREYLSGTDVPRPSFHATAITHHIAGLLAADRARVRAKALAPIRELVDEFGEMYSDSKHYALWKRFRAALAGEQS